MRLQEVRCDEQFLHMTSKSSKLLVLQIMLEAVLACFGHLNEARRVSKLSWKQICIILHYFAKYNLTSSSLGSSDLATNMQPKSRVRSLPHKEALHDTRCFASQAFPPGLSYHLKHIPANMQ